MMTTPPICTKCKNVSLNFNDDGTGFCNICSRTFIWNRPGVPEPPVCRRCKNHSLSFRPEGYGWCQNCYNKFVWDANCNIDLTELSIPQKRRVGDQPSFRSGEHNIQSAIFSKGEKTKPGDFIGDTKVEYEGDAIVLSLLLHNERDLPVNEIVIRPVCDPKKVDLEQEEMMIPVLRTREKRVVSFKIWPNGGASKLVLHAEVRYLNTELDEYLLKTTEKNNIVLPSPTLHRVKIEEDIFRSLSTGLISAEAEYKEIKMEGEQLFEMMRDLLRNNNMYLLPPRVQANDNLFRGLQWSYAEDGENNNYQCMLEIIGGPSRSNLLVNFLASEARELVGFSSNMKSHMEKRVDTAALSAGTQVVQQHIHGDFIQEGASKVGIHDSVVQRSNIGTDIHTNDGLDDKIEWLDERNRERAARLRGGQRMIGSAVSEIKGMTKDLSVRMERHFSEIIMDLPYPADIQKKRGTVTMEYRCSLCDDYIGKIKDRRWLRWVNFAVGAGMIGVGIAAFSAEIGGKGMKKMYNDLTGKQLDDLPKNSMFLTSEEKDKMLTFLRDEGILQKMNYCPSCKNWVCDNCFNQRSLTCEKHAY